MLDNKRCAGTVLMNFSKEFDTLNYELLTAELHTYGFSKEALKITYNYLIHRKLQHSVLGLT